MADLRAQGRVGTVLRGKYRLDRVLGVGGMAVVYKATHRNEAEFAVKMLHPELSIRGDIRTRFLREGKAANSVKHPGAVLVVDDDVAEDGAAFLVMELLHGAEVEDLLERCHHRMPVRAVLSVADQLLDVLTAAHAKGIVHRDIKPANLFATRDGTLKVLDFGIARVREAAASQGGGNATGTGMLLGTPAFMAPEQAYAKASEIDGQTDVWAVGATLFTLLSGQFVHQGENASQLMIRAATEPARSVRSVVPDVPPGVAQVIDRALAFEKAARWPSAAAMREAVERASLEAFGERPSKGVLATLVSGNDLGRAKTELPPVVSSRDMTATSAPFPPTLGIAVPTPPSALIFPRLSGGTTAQPVSSEPLAAPPGVRSGRRAALGIAIVSGIAVVLVAGGLVLRVSLGGQRGAAAGAANPSTPVPAAATSVASTPTAAAAGASVPPGVVDAGTVSVTDLPIAKPSPTPGQFGAQSPVTPKPSPLLVVVSPRPAPTPTQICTTITEYDQDRQPHFKSVCH